MAGEGASAGRPNPARAGADTRSTTAARSPVAITSPAPNIALPVLADVHPDPVLCRPPAPPISAAFRRGQRAKANGAAAAAVAASAIAATTAAGEIAAC